MELTVSTYTAVSGGLASVEVVAFFLQRIPVGEQGSYPTGLE